MYQAMTFYKEEGKAIGLINKCKKWEALIYSETPIHQRGKRTTLAQAHNQTTWMNMVRLVQAGLFRWRPHKDQGWGTIRKEKAKCGENSAKESWWEIRSKKELASDKREEREERYKIFMEMRAEKIAIENKRVALEVERVAIEGKKQHLRHTGLPLSSLASPSSPRSPWFADTSQRW